MFVKNVWFVQLAAFSAAFLVRTDVNVTEANNHAAKEIISKLIKESERTNVLFVYSNSELFDYFMRSHDLEIAVELNTLTTMSDYRTRNITATILHLEDYCEFEVFFNLIRPDHFLYSGHFIVFFNTADETEIEKMFSKFWKAFIYNVNVLVTNPLNSDLVSVLTFMPFANGSCGNTKPMRINELNKTSMGWTTNIFFPKKFEQLNRCPLRFGCYERAPRLIVDRIENGSMGFRGISYDILNILSEALNFTVKVWYKDTNVDVLINRTLDNEQDLYFSSVQIYSRSVLSCTVMVYSDAIVLVVPPPVLIDPMTKVFLPFKFTSWISIGMVALLAYGFVKILNFTPKIVHNYVIGSNIECSALSVWMVFLGGTIQKLPRSNFPRFLLTTFVIFTLIMRSLYQGAVFDIMKRDVHTNELNTIDEYIDHEYTLYVWTDLANRTEGSRVLQSKHQVIAFSEVKPYSLQTLDPSFKGGVFGYSTEVLSDNMINRKNFTLRICKQVMYTTSFAFYFTKNFYLVDEFDVLIERLKCAGLIDYVMSVYKDVDSMKTNQKNPPSAISYSHIEGFFSLFYFGCGAAIFTFVLENIFGYMEQRQRRL